jgi:hypothetical protein
MYNPLFHLPEIHHKRYLKLSPTSEAAVEAEVKMLLHAHRDCLRNRGDNTARITFNCTEGYYGEAFGVLRGLKVLGFGEFGSVNMPHPLFAKWNLKWWFTQLEQEVLEEENYKTTQECDYCLEHYGKDGAGRNRLNMNLA